MIKKTKLYVPFDKILSRCSTGLNPRKKFVLGHGSRSPGCKETAVNSEDPAAHCLLNPVNRLCAQVKRMFAVHLRIHRKNVPLWLNEKAFQREKMGEHGVRQIPVVLLQKNLLIRENPQKTGCFRPLATLLFILLFL